jgi:hypothetical protein
MLSSDMNLTPDTERPAVEGKPDNEPEHLTERALRLRIRQQELLAELGVLALQRVSFNDLLNHAARMTAEGLGAKFWNTIRQTSVCLFARASAGAKE